MKNSKIETTELRGGEKINNSVSLLKPQKNKEKDKTMIEVRKMQVTVNCENAKEITQEVAEKRVMAAIQSGDFVFSTKALSAPNKHKIVLSLPEEENLSYANLCEMRAKGQISDDEFTAKVTAKATKGKKTQ